MASDGSFSEWILQGPESGFDQEIDQSNVSEGLDLEIMCKHRLRYSPTKLTRNSCVELKALESNDKMSKDIEGKRKCGDKRHVEPLIPLSYGEHGKYKEVNQ